MQIIRRRRLPKNVYSEVTRHGRRVYYFREEKGQRVRLPDAASADFARAIDLARESGLSIAVKPEPRPTFDILRKREVGLALQAAIRSARGRASRRGMDFDLDEDWALELAERQEFKCCLTSIPFYMKTDATSKVRPYGPSLDRIDSKKGYISGNIQWVHTDVNRMKLDYPQDYFIQMCRRVANIGGIWLDEQKGKL